MSTIETNPNIRVINGRRIERFRHGGGRITWEQVTQPGVEESQVYNQKTGKTERIRRRHPAVVHWRHVLDPEATILGLNASCALRPFDVREPSPIHDEMERAQAAGFHAWAAQLAAMGKVKPRPELKGIPLGNIMVSRGVRALPVGDGELRELLARHAEGDWGDNGSLGAVELTDDSRWCAPLFGETTINAAAVEKNSGLVRSKYTRTYQEGRGPESVEVVTHIGETTIVYAPSRDAC